MTNSVSNPDKHISVAQIGPSVTTLTKENPAYGLIETDSEYLLPMNYQMYAMNVTAANENNRADWNLTVDYVKDYNLTDYVTPNEMYSLSKRVANSTELAKQFMWDMSRKKGDLADVDFDGKNGERGSALYLGCTLGTSETYEEEDCKGWKRNDWKKKPAEVLLDWIVGNWVTRK